MNLFFFLRWLWILSTFIVCVTIAIGLTFLLAPRSMKLSNTLVDLYPYNITYIYDINNETIGINIFFEEKFHIQNDNFYEVHMKNLTLELNRISHLTSPQIAYDRNVPIAPRSSIDLVVKVKYIMYTVNDAYAGLCIKGIINELFALITTTFSFSTLWNSSEEATVKSTQYLYCTLNDFVKKNS
jgi:hypothetical protein